MSATNPRIVLPPPLRRGGRIGVVTPSSPGPMLFADRWRHAIAALEGLGFEVVPGRLSRRSQAHRSGTARERADEINEFLADDGVDCVMASIGGWNSASTLPFLDYGAFQRFPKPVVGYSDFTSVLLALHVRTDVVTFHGPMVIPSFGEWPRPFAETTASFMSSVVEQRGDPVWPAAWTDEFLEWSNGTWKSRPRTLVPNSGPQLFRGGAAQGRLVGGNLDTLCSLLGTVYCPSFDNAILLVEESDKNLREYERNLNQLALHGVFDCIAGMIVGKSEHLRGESADLTALDLLAEAVGTREMPILVDADVGHTCPMVTLPIGADVRIATCPPTIGVEWPVSTNGARQGVMLP